MVMDRWFLQSLAEYFFSVCPFPVERSQIIMYNKPSGAVGLDEMYKILKGSSSSTVI